MTTKSQQMNSIPFRNAHTEEYEEEYPEYDEIPSIKDQQLESLTQQNKGNQLNSSDRLSSPQSVKKTGPAYQNDASSPQTNGQKAFDLNAAVAHQYGLSKEYQQGKGKEITFGVSDLNAIFGAAIQSNSPKTKKPNPSKIEQMLEEHRKRKALQKVYEFADDEEIQQPILANKPPNLGEMRPTSSREEFNANLTDDRYNQEQNKKQAFGTVSQENGKQVVIVNEYEKTQYSNNPRTNTFGEIINEGSTNFEETGRFKAFDRMYQEDSIADRKVEEPLRRSNKFSTGQKSSESSPSRRNNEQSSSLSNSPDYVPKISETSKMIFVGSERAKDDESLINELLVSKIRQLSGGDKDQFELQKIPEENEESPENQDRTTRAQGNSPKTQQGLSPKRQDSSPKKKAQDETMKSPISGFSTIVRGNSNNPSISVDKRNSSTEKILKKAGPENIDLSKARAVNESQNKSSAPSGGNSPSRQKTSKFYDTPDKSTSIDNSPKSIKGNTVIEYKKPLRTREKMRESQGSSDGFQTVVSPSKKEIKEIANATRNIYVRMVQNTRNYPDSPETSPKRKNDDSASPKSARKQQPSDIMASELVKKVAENAKTSTLNKMTKEEIEKYDEIQRLEIILTNLRKIQKANLLAQLYGQLESSSPKSKGSTFQAKTNWPEYAGTINESAAERRLVRRIKEEERLARLTKSSSPQPMEKVALNAESLYSSAVLRKKLFPDGEGGKNDTQENEEQGSRDVDYNDLYERNIQWLMTRNTKVEKLSDIKANEEIKDCTFKPTFFTKGYFSNLESPQRSHMESSNLALNSMSDRLPSPKDKGSDYVVNGRKSLYREKKSMDSYSHIFDIKKAYNLYRADRDPPEKNLKTAA